MKAFLHTVLRGLQQVKVMVMGQLVTCSLGMYVYNKTFNKHVGLLPFESPTERPHDIGVQQLQMGWPIEAATS